MWLLALSIIFQVQAAETQPTPIQQAQALAIKKNRQEACAVLKGALEGASGKQRAKISEMLQQVSTMFFTDKGQKAFEAGQAAMWDTPEIALAHFREAQTLEDNNVQVLNNIARVHLMKQDCENATQAIQYSRKLNPVFGESALLELRALACQKKFEVLREKTKSLPALDKWEESYVQYLSSLDGIQQKAWKKSLDAMTKVSEEQPQFPESYYVLAKASQELGKDAEPWLQKYVSLCKVVTVRERKKFSLEPRLCANQKEAEDELAKKPTEL